MPKTFTETKIYIHILVYKPTYCACMTSRINSLVRKVVLLSVYHILRVLRNHHTNRYIYKHRKEIVI